MKVLKLNQDSVISLMNNLKTSYDIEKFKYFDKTYGGFDMKRDSLNCVDGHFLVNDINLDPNITDFENAKELFSSFNGKLTPEDADDERLWTYLTHFTFFKYVQTRWVDDEKSREVLEDRFFYKGLGRLSRTRNAVSRLWWIPYLTFNPIGKTEEEKWKHTKAAFSSQEVFVSLFERTMGSYRNVRTAFLDFIINNKPQSKEVQYLARKINNLGGVYLLPTISYERISEILQYEHENYDKE